MSNLNGLPLLSGPLSEALNRTDNACRKCNKEFNVFFTRATRCNHCGYSYCPSCADYQALMPRHAPTSGYDPVQVCAFCIELLNITASSKNQLKSLPLSNLRRYVDAYNIPVKRPIDKIDLVDAIIAAKAPTGTLPHQNESYYRTNAVPKHRAARPRGFFSTRPPPPTQPSTSASSPDFPRPDLDPQSASYRTYTTSSRQPPPPPPRPPRTASQPPASAPPSNASPPPTPNTRPSTSPHSPPQPSMTPVPPPPLSTILTMPPSSLSRLPVHTLKQILYDARVRLPTAVLEKGELVARVTAWVDEEKRAAEERDREEREQEKRERERERQEREREEQDQLEQFEAETSVFEAESADPQTHSPSFPADDAERPPSPPPKAPQPRSPLRTMFAERSGLCAICQDQDANIAVVDCGHMSMCRDCSELVFTSTRECPICRTRIVSEARLLRIFKT